MAARGEGGGPAEYGIPAPSYRLPARTRVGPVRLQVSDLERSLEYYGDVLGFRVLGREEGRAALGPGGARDGHGGAAGQAPDPEPLMELRERPGAVRSPRRGRLGLYHFAILLPDRGALGRFVRHLGELGVRAGASDHRVSEALYLQDPDGLGIEVYADRPRADWRREGGELVMATEPLDLAGLVGEAGDAAWAGMPAGTVIGHVHLHVGDLEEAASFYHEALGLDKVVWSYPGALFLSAGGYHHHLGLNTWAGPGARPAADTDARLLEWELVVPAAEDVEAAAGSLDAGGHPVERSGAAMVTRDPWGTSLRIRPA